MVEDSVDNQVLRLVLPFVDPFGDWDLLTHIPGRRFYKRGELRHRLDGPAWSADDGSYAWYFEDLPHRIDGPASLTKHDRISAEKYRHVPPKRHGSDSPMGRQQWCESYYEQGILHRLDGPALRWQDGAEEWFVSNQRHRERLPAVIGGDGLREWHFSDRSVALEDAVLDLSYYRTMANADNFYRERGPSVIMPDGTRYWGGSPERKYYGVGEHEDQAPSSGPWIETRDGRVVFVDGGGAISRSPDFHLTVELRRDARLYVAERLSTFTLGSVTGDAILPWMDRREALERAWLGANEIQRERYARSVLQEWEALQGNLSHADEGASSSWIERFVRTVHAEREELRLGREDMKGYLRVALRRLEGAERTWRLDDLQSAIEYAGLPLSGAVAALTVESRLARVVVTAPTITQAVPAEIVPSQATVPAKRSVRAPKVRNELYVNGIAELALGALAAVARSQDAFDADTVLLNVMVDDIDVATGNDIRYCVLSIQVEREEFERFDLHRVEPLECVRRLGAVVPRGSTELSPVRPIIEFDKEDARIVLATEVASHLESRANLMELSPTEFESLIQNLFTKIGLDTHQTQASRDGGVDAIAYDSRPIFGGKIIIQAKRYKNTVGVSAVRDLYGTVLNEGAGKGLLVTTSGYGKSSYEFAKNKPLELLEGGHLLHLLKEHLGLDAVIIPPATWVDPAPDIQESDQPAGA